MGTPAIRVESLGKRYRLTHTSEGRVGYRTLRESLTRGVATLSKRARGKLVRRSAEEFWALQDVSFEVQSGEVVGIIGRNGAGKSTLLKILSRITKPTTGRVEINGRVGSLLEVGTGFHPELTGRENIYLNGSILGMSRKEIAQKFHEIVSFAEVEKFLDLPVKRYSSGMYVRLAFAVAAHLEPEILIIDEVLAVGDAGFQRRCIGKMGEVARSGRTVLVVSHNMASVTNLCSSAIQLSSGHLSAVGDPQVVVQKYLAESRPAQMDSVNLSDRPRPPWAVPLMRWSKCRTLGSDDGPHVSLGGGLEIRVAYDTADHPPLRMPVLGLVINHAVFGTVGGINTRMAGFVPDGTQHNRGVITCRLPQTCLLQGHYSVDLWLGDGPTNVDLVESAISFHVEATDIYGSGIPPLANLGVMFFQADWAHTES